MTILWTLLMIYALVHSGVNAKEENQDKKTDLKTAESRVLPYGGLGGYGQPGFGADPYPVEFDGLNTFGQYPRGLPLHKPIGLIPGLIRDPGYLRSGVSDGSLAIGHGGGEAFSAGTDGRYGDGSFHEGRLAHDGGYHGLEGYRDNKHHVADDFANRGYYSGAHGVRKDLGNGEVFDKNHGFALNSVNTVGDSALAGHNKGHHKTGFRKSYHKDESGNDESYFDSNHDEGNHALGKNFGNNYFTNEGSQLNRGHKLNEFEARHGGNDGYDGSGKLLAVNQGVRDFYGKNGHYGAANGYGSLGAGKYSNIDRYGLQNGFNNGRSFQDYRGANYGPIVY